MSTPETSEAEGGKMDEAIGPLSIKPTWSAKDGRYSYQIAWTSEQLQRIGQAIKQGDEAYLEQVEEAIRRALKLALAHQIPETNELKADVQARLGGVRPSDFRWHQDDRR